jgi:hypothetical protein
MKLSGKVEKTIINLGEDPRFPVFYGVLDTLEVFMMLEV